MPALCIFRRDATILARQMAGGHEKFGAGDEETTDVHATPGLAASADGTGNRLALPAPLRPRTKLGSTPPPATAPPAIAFAHTIPGVQAPPRRERGAQRREPAADQTHTTVELMLPRRRNLLERKEVDLHWPEPLPNPPLLNVTPPAAMPPKSPNTYVALPLQTPPRTQIEAGLERASPLPMILIALLSATVGALATLWFLS